MSSTPRIVVLMATHNGGAYIEEQLNSVLNQAGVDLQVIVSDDNSSDETTNIVRARAALDSRISMLPAGHFGSAGKNFYRLILDADVTSFHAVAFCDQDDIWEPWKLRRHFDLLMHPDGIDGLGPYAAISSNVAAVNTSGRRQLIVKNQLQRENDYVFESGGPGSTFLLRLETFAFIREQLDSPQSPAQAVTAHDWCMYALVRASGRRWFIDGEPSVLYRQHSNNVLGANEGLRQHVARLRQIANGSHRRDVERVLAACIPVAHGRTLVQLEWLQQIVVRRNVIDRIRLARQSYRLRRRRRDQLALAAVVVAGIW